MIDNVTLRAFFREFRDGSADLSEATLGTYSADVSNLANCWLETHADELLLVETGREAIEGAMNWLVSNGRSKATANRCLRSAKAVCNWAAERGRMPDRPPRIKPFRETKRLPTAWKPEEFDAILGAAEHLRGPMGESTAAAVVSCTLRVLHNTGARLSAGFGIRSEWVDLAAAHPQIRIGAEVQKDGEEQQVDLLPGTVEAIRQVGSIGRLERLLGDWPYQARTFDEWLRQLIVDAGLRPTLKDVTRHDLAHKIRRCYATQLYVATGDIEYVRQKLGHSRAETTLRYIDFSQVPRKGEREYLREPRPRPMQLLLFGDKVG